MRIGGNRCWELDSTGGWRRTWRGRLAQLIKAASQALIKPLIGDDDDFKPEFECAWLLKAHTEAAALLELTGINLKTGTTADYLLLSHARALIAAVESAPHRSVLERGKVFPLTQSNSRAK